MKFELPFEENIYKEQIELIFKIAWKKFFAETKKTAIAAVLSIFFGIIILDSNRDIGGSFILLGIIFTVIALTRWNKYNEAKKTTQKTTFENIEKWKQKPISVWEFEDDYFRFEFYGGDYKINWDNFKYYNIVDKTLFFGFNESGNWYTLSESEIGKEDFQKVAEFVFSKIKPALQSLP